MSDDLLDIRLELTDIRECLFPGSPAYVRKLRDRAAKDILAAIHANPSQDRFGFDTHRQAREYAVDEANALIAALGYQVPGEEPSDA